MIIGISGQAGSGKDTVADFLVEDFTFCKVALADPIKRFCAEVFNFSEQQLWGPSQYRNEPDTRYHRPEAALKKELTEKNQQIKMTPKQSRVLEMYAEGYDLDEIAEVLHLNEKRITETINKNNQSKSIMYLTPRYALQTIGTELGRACYDDVWVDYAIRTAKALVQAGKEGALVTYSAQFGIDQSEYNGVCNYKGVVISDCRFRNELLAIKKEEGKTIRVVRPGAGLEGEAAAHRSEAEMREIPDEMFDHVIINDGTLDELREKVAKVVKLYI
jgi:hypothetical protein